MKGYKDKKHSLIGQVSTGEFGANWFLKMKPRLWLAYFMKGMLFGCEQPFLWGSVAWHPKKRLQRRLRKNPRLLFLLSHLPLAIAVVVSRSPHYRSKNGHLWKGHRKSAIHCAHTQSQVLQSDWPRIRNHYSAHVQKFGPYTQRSQLLVLNKRSAISG